MKPHTVAILSTLLAVLASMLLQSCSNIPAGVVQPGATGYITQAGGMMKLKSPAGAELEVDNRESFKALTKVVDNGIIAWALTNITKGIDDNATSVDKANIDAQSKAASEKSANAAAKEANRHTEAMTELVPEEVPIVPTP